MLNTITAILDAGAGGGGGSYESIATVTGTGSSGTITFSSIPSTYVSLQVRYSALASGNQAVNLRLNNDSATSYWWHELVGNGTAASAQGINSTEIRVSGAGTDASFPQGAIIDIHNYASTTQNKTVRILTGTDKNGSGRIELRSGLWGSTSATNRLDLICGSNFATGSTFALYGIKGA